MFKKSILSLSVVGLMAGAQSALAYEQGDIIVKAGAAIVEPNESSSTIRITGPALGDTGIGEVGVGTDTQLGLSATYMYSNAFGVEVLAATPFTHDITLPALGGAKIAETTHLPPTVTLNWYIANPNDKFQPFVGAGLNYTIFFDESTAPALNAGAFNALSGAAGGPAITSVAGTDIDLDDSFGLAIHAGFDYALTENIGLSVSYYHIDIETTATITTTANGSVPITAKVDVDIDPSVYLLGVSYKF